MAQIDDLNAAIVVLQTNIVDLTAEVDKIQPGTAPDLSPAIASVSQAAADVAAQTAKLQVKFP